MGSAVSETDIYNRALTKLGSSLITATSDNNKRAKTIDNMYAMVRDSELRKNPWNFNVKRDVLAQDAAAPAWGFANRYILPTDFILLVEIKNHFHYRIEDGYILTDDTDTGTATTLSIRYIARTASTAQYDSIFVEALATQLAIQACLRITRSNTIKASLENEYIQIIAEAKFRDGFEDDPQENIEDVWVQSRESSNQNYGHGR